MDPNLQIKSHVGCKELLLRKLSYAVISSVLSQVIIIFLLSFLINVDVLHPIQWWMQSFSSLTSISTWLFIIPFLSIIFAQSIICAKDYVLKSTYCSTRIQKVLSVFSIHNLLLLLLHVLIGGVEVWLFLSLAGGNYGSLYVSCQNDKYCLNTETFYLTLSGLWTGFYFFVTIYTSEKKILFPVVRQRKILQFKTTLLPLLKQSQRAAFKPIFYYYVLYYLWGQRLQSSFMSFFWLHKQDATLGFMVNSYAWFFASLYILNMNLMRFFYEMFLTEPIQFPIVAATKHDFTLSEALNISNIPIVQQLACLDLFLLSYDSKQRREVLFTLSQPGNHPHNWNNLVTNALNIIDDYVETLNKSTVGLSASEEKLVSPVKSPSMKNYAFRNIRNMSLQPEDVLFEVEVSQSKGAVTQSIELLTVTTKEKLRLVISTLRTILGINFLFGELPVANIECCLSNGQTMIWTTQGLSSLAVASLTEDRFGIVQKDLVVIVSSLVALKQSLDKLNKIPGTTRKGHTFDDFSNKMKVAVYSAVKRSLYNICNHFGEYLKDLPLNAEVLQVLQIFVNNKNI